MKELRNIASIIIHINENGVKDNKISIVTNTNIKLMEVRDVVGVFITNEDKYTTLNFESIGKEDGVCALEINTIDKYNIETQELILKL